MHWKECLTDKQWFFRLEYFIKSFLRNEVSQLIRGKWTAFVSNDNIAAFQQKNGNYGKYVHHNDLDLKDFSDETSVDIHECGFFMF